MGKIPRNKMAVPLIRDGVPSGMVNRSQLRRLIESTHPQDEAAFYIALEQRDGVETGVIESRAYWRAQAMEWGHGDRTD